MSRWSVTPLFIGTLVLRASAGAGTIVLGLFLAQLASYRSHTITSIQVGLLAVAFFATELTLAPFMGALSDRWGRRTFMVVAPCIGLVEVALIPFAPPGNPLPYLLGLQVLAGITSAMQVPAVLGYLADFTMRDHALRMRVMSLYELATSGGIAVGVVLGGFAWEHFGRYAFLLLASFYLVVALCMLLTPKVTQVVEHVSLRGLAARYWRVVHTPRLFIFIPAWIAVCALVGIWLGSQVPFLLSSHRHDPQQLLVGSMSGPGGGARLSLVLGGYVLFFGLCLIFWAFFLGRAPRLTLMLTSVLGVYIACIALFGINHGGFGNTVLLFVWIPVLLVGIFAETSFAPAALAYLADISEEAAKDRGLLMGLYSVFLGLGQLLGNGIGGVFARNFGFDGLIYLTALLAFVALLSLLGLYWHEKRVSQLLGGKETLY
jgi:MFS family permease